MSTALAANNVSPALFVTLNFANSVTVNVWTGYGTATYNSTEWIGLGTLLSLETIEEGTNVEARGTAVVLSGLDSTLGDVQADFQLGLPAAIYLTFYYEGSLISPPVTAFLGRMDACKVKIGADSSKITINLESRMLDMDIAPDLRYTDAQQQQIEPGDLGFLFQTQTLARNLYWGTIGTGANNV